MHRATDRKRLDRARQPIEDPAARLEEEVTRLGNLCRARELALERMAQALHTLRRANHALSEEHTLLRQQIEQLQGRPSS